MKYISLVTAGLLTIGATYLSANKIEFIGMDAPKTIDEMTQAYSNAKVRVHSSDKKFKEYPLSYNKLFGVKDQVGTNKFPAGTSYDYKGNPILDPYGKVVIAETPDANSLLKVDNKLFLVTHYEYDWILSNGADIEKIDNWYTRMPMSMTLTSINQKKDGKLVAKDQKPINFSNVDGLWIPCFGSQTPWNTHLGGEEDYDLYFTAASGDKNFKKAQKGLKALDEKYFLNEKKSNPYHYGFMVEVKVKGDSSYDVAKHYAMGRGTWEMAKIMPDKRTAYFGDDGANVGLFMFVADKEKNLDSGTLYAAKWNQTSPNGDKNGGTANLTWYKLGNSDSKTIKKYADTLKFSDIFDSVSKKEYNPELHKDYKPVIAGHSEIEYLKLKSGMETAAAFLETRRYAAYVGATTEWNKMEGVASNTKDKKLYIAMSYIDKGMRENSEFKTDDIKIAKNNCGGTYELNMKSNQMTVGGEKINSDFVAVDMSIPSILLGEEIAPDAVGNTCHVDKIANTDNVFFSDKMRTLFIGEDSGTHVNNFVWAYNVDTKKLSRILSMPAGAESTGLQVVDDINGHAYIMSNAQHVGDYTKNTKDELKKEFDKKLDKFDAPIGYIHGIPAIK
jgi:secreted PhoX family phosphatase